MAVLSPGLEHRTVSDELTSVTHQWCIPFAAHVDECLVAVPGRWMHHIVRIVDVRQAEGMSQLVRDHDRLLRRSSGVVSPELRVDDAVSDRAVTARLSVSDPRSAAVERPDDDTQVALSAWRPGRNDYVEVAEQIADLVNDLRLSNRVAVGRPGARTLFERSDSRVWIAL